MLRRIRFKPLLALDSMIDLLRWDDPLFHKTVRDHGRNRAMEEVQDPVMNPSQADAKFVDAVAVYSQYCENANLRGKPRQGRR